MTEKQFIKRWRKNPNFYNKELSSKEIEFFTTTIDYLEDWGEEYANIVLPIKKI